jgi:hypothetical protein
MTLANLIGEKGKEAELTIERIIGFHRLRLSNHRSKLIVRTMANKCNPRICLIFVCSFVF